MPRQRKPKTKAVILPPEYDDIDEDTGSVMPDDDGWVTLEGKDGTVAEGGSNPGDGVVSKAKRVVRPAAKRRTKRARGNS